MGARNKLAEAFVADMLADWQEHGADAIARTRESDPAAYVRIVVGLLPRHVGLDDDTCSVAGLSDNQLERLIRVLTQAGEADA